MTALKLSANGRRGLVELERAARRMRGHPQPLEIRAVGVVDAADEVLVMVVTRQGALVRASRVHGRAIDARELHLQLAAAEAAVEEVARTPPAPASPQLTSADAAMLDEAGMVEGPLDVPSPLERTRIELELLVRSSLTIDEAAKALGVNTSRIRQRLSPKHRTLCGIKHGRGWRIPRFQFESKNRLVRNIDKVLPHIRYDAHPLEIREWFTMPH